MRVNLDKKGHGMNYEGILSDVRSSSHLPYASQGGYKTLQQQWIAFLAAHHPISGAERVPQIRHFVSNFRVNLGRKCIVWPISGFQMLSDSPHIYLMYQRKLLNHFSSNVQPHLPLQYITPFFCVERAPQIWYCILCAVWELALIEMTQCDR